MPELTAAIYGGPIPGIPMSVQQVYTEMIGRDGLTAEKLQVLPFATFFRQFPTDIVFGQVYTYLKRLGYVVMRTEPLDAYYPTPRSFRTCSNWSRQYLSESLHVYEDLSHVLSAS